MVDKMKAVDEARAAVVAAGAIVEEKRLAHAAANDAAWQAHNAYQAAVADRDGKQATLEAALAALPKPDASKV